MTDEQNKDLLDETEGTEEGVESVEKGDLDNTPESAYSDPNILTGDDETLEGDDTDGTNEDWNSDGDDTE